MEYGRVTGEAEDQQITVHTLILFITALSEARNIKFSANLLNFISPSHAIKIDGFIEDHVMNSFIN